MPETSDHRTSFTARSGDTHVIGAEDHAEAVNVDAAARDRALAEAAAAPVLGDDGSLLNPPQGDPSADPSAIVSGKRSRAPIEPA